MPEHVTEAAQQLDVLMTEADEFCRQQHMLALARPQLLIDFARWYLDEFTRQVTGQPPRAWDGPLELQPV